MIKRLNIELKGDKALWFIALLLAIVSFMAVYSASSNLTWNRGGDTPQGYLFKHFITLFSGGAILYFFHRLNYRYFAPFSVIAFPFTIILLVYTLMQGNTIGDANASRWVTLPVVGFTFQSSALASLVLMVYLARYLSKNEGNIKSLKQMWLPLLLPIGLVCALILPANFSTTALIFLMSMVVMFLGGVALKPLAQIAGLGVLSLAFFIGVVLIFPNISNRVSTWKARIENFSEGSAEANYQVDKAKMAIAEGMVTGKGPGKSVQKNFLPQSNSDFIFAIIVEEYGLVGGSAVLLLYVFLFFRILKIALSAPNIYGTLLAISAGLGLILQALINMGVAVNVLPVTGQTLPLISSGGTSVWMTCAALGIILSVSQAKKDDVVDETEPFENQIDDVATA